MPCERLATPWEKCTKLCTSFVSRQLASTFLFCLLASFVETHQDNRELRRRCRGTLTTLLYNAVLNIDFETKKNSPPSCSPREKARVLSTLGAKFDKIVNAKSEFRDDFYLNTDFCNEHMSSNHRELEMEQEQSHNGQMVDQDVHNYIKTELGHGDDEALQRALELRIHDWTRDYFLRGHGTCYLCSPDSSDVRRRRLDDDDETQFYRASRKMEKEIEKEMTKAIKMYSKNKRHCLYKTKATVAVHILPVDNRHDQINCRRPPSIYCCAPAKDPADVCSQDKKKHGEDGFCHKSQDNCEDECEGVWVDVLNPPTAA